MYALRSQQSARVPTHGIRPLPRHQSFESEPGSKAQADIIANAGFRNFSEIAIIFTAVAIPARMIERSRGFEWLAAVLGQHFGRLRLRSPRAALPLLVAHRLSTLRDADRIFVFADGHIVETGTYAELLDKGGVFTRLVRSAEGKD